MRPVRLELEGFTSFRSRTVIEFDGLDLFAITGATGSGKTSLIDSILFALYGRTPRLGKTSSSLISQGAAEMRVLLEFEAGGRRYQALRFVKRKGPGKQRLDERTSDGEAWDTIADRASLMDTKISELLGLAFEGFTKTVVLPQGEFDRFLRGEAQERREILIRLLGLEIYARMMRRANETAAAQTQRASTIEDEWKSRVAGLSPERIAELEDLLDALRSEEGPRQEELDRVSQLIPLQARLRMLRSQFAERERLRLQRAPLEELLTKQSAAVDAAQKACTKAEAEALAARDRAQGMEAEGSPDLLRSQANAIRKALERRAEIAKQKELLTKSVQQWQELQKLSDSSKAAVGAAEAAHVASIQENAADQLRSHLHSGDECPVCEQIVLIVPPLQAGSTVEAARQALDRARKTAETAEATARKLEKQVGQLQATIKTQERDLIDTAENPESLEQKAAAIEAVKREAGTLEAKAASLNKQLQQEKAKLVDAQTNLRVLQGKWEAIESQLAGEQSVEAIEAELGAFAGRDLETERKRLQAELQQFNRQLVQAEAAIVSAKQTLAQWQERSVEVRELRRQAEIAKKLGGLLQQNQFQDFVLAQTLRRLAVEGTRQLRHLSSNRYSFATEGSEFLVVDHWNADEQRSVNTLSGGESFLASLSLALALARSLPDFSVNRDAIRLDSLFLDEGFSTLDTETMQIVLDAIELLQADGRMIGVVSHIPELAERLPARIEVGKAPGGSTVTVCR